MVKCITYVGLDVHKNSIDVAVPLKAETMKFATTVRSVVISTHWTKLSGNLFREGTPSDLSMKPGHAAMRFIAIFHDKATTALWSPLP